MARLFGTDGVRGIANEQLTYDLAHNLGRAGAYVLTPQFQNGRILVACDTRASGDMLESALVSGILSAGSTAVVTCTLPTSAVAYLTRVMRYDAGVMISASHNSMEYNGIKFFNSEGYKLADEIEDEIAAVIEDGCSRIPHPVGTQIGRCVRLVKAASEYIDYVVSTSGAELDGLKVVLDCANGAASEVAPWVFKMLGAEVLPYYNMPDGNNINDGCGATHPGQLSRIVTEIGADVGLAFDGDADRLIAVDEHGNIVDGDKIMTICALALKKEGKLAEDTLVGTVMSNMGMEITLKRNGIRLVRTDVGDRYVLESMVENGFRLGGEQSGHIIFLDKATTGDGIISGVQLLGVMKREGRTLSKLAEQVDIYPQVLVNAKVPEDRKLSYAEDSEIGRAINALTDRFGGSGRVLIRPSGTEPLVRVMIEGPDEKAVSRHAAKLARLIEQRMA